MLNRTLRILAGKASLCLLLFCALQTPFVSVFSSEIDYDRKFAVIIAIDEYDNPYFRKLSNCVYDCVTLRDTLIRDYGYKPENISELYDSKANCEAVLKKLAELKDICQPNDSFLFVFSGHGSYSARVEGAENDRIVSCLVCADRPDENKHLLRSDTLISAASNIKTKHKLFLIDACYSGGFFLEAKTSGEPQFPEIENSFTDNFKLDGFWLLSAGGFQGVYAANGQKSHSIFMSAVLQSLRDRCDSQRHDQAFGFRHFASNVELIVQANAASKGQQVQSGTLGPSGPLSGEFILRPTQVATTPGRLRQLRDYAALLRQLDVALSVGDRGMADALFRSGFERFFQDGKMIPFEWQFEKSRLARLPRSIRLPPSSVNGAAVRERGDGFYLAQGDGHIHYYSLDLKNAKIDHKSDLVYSSDTPVYVFGISMIGDESDSIVCLYGEFSTNVPNTISNLRLVLIDPVARKVTPLYTHRGGWAGMSVYRHANPPVIAVNRIDNPNELGPKKSTIAVLDLAGKPLWSKDVVSGSMLSPMLAPLSVERPWPHLATTPGGEWSLYVPQLDSNSQQVVVEYGMRGDERSTVFVGSKGDCISSTSSGDLLAIGRKGAGFFHDIVVYEKRSGVWRDSDVLRHHTSPIQAIRFVQHDRNLPLISLDANGVVCVWETGSGKLTDCISAHKGLGNQLSLDSAEKEIITTGTGQSGAELSISQRKREGDASLRKELPDGDYSLYQLPHSKKVCAVSDTVIGCYDIVSRKVVWKRNTNFRRVLAVATSRDERRLCFVASNDIGDPFQGAIESDQHLVEIDIATSNNVLDEPCPHAVDISTGFEDTDFLLTCWSKPPGKSEKPSATEIIYKRNHLFREVAGGSVISVCFGGENKTSIATGEQVTLANACPSTKSIVFGGTTPSHDHSLSGFVRLRSWQGNVEKLLASREGAVPRGFSFSADGARLICAWSDGMMSFFDLQDINDVREARVPGRTLLTSFSMSDSRFLTGCMNGDLNIWDATSGENLLSLGTDVPVFDAILSESENKVLVSRGGSVEVVVAK